MKRSSNPNARAQEARDEATVMSMVMPRMCGERTLLAAARGNVVRLQNEFRYFRYRFSSTAADAIRLSCEISIFAFDL